MRSLPTFNVSPTPTMTSTLRSRFIAAEQQFLSAFGDGEDALAAFAATWSSLLRAFSIAKEASQLDSETLSLIHTTVSRVSTLADSFLILSNDANELCDQYASRFADILAKSDSSSSTSGFTSPSAPPSPEAPCLIPSEYADASSTSPSPSLDILAHQWLLQNLHDPYPPTTVRTLMAEACGCLVKDIQDWFAAMRRQIGWTALCREKFGGSRQRTSDAARRAYTPESDDGTLTVPIRNAFAAIQRNAYEASVTPLWEVGKDSTAEDTSGQTINEVAYPPRPSYCEDDTTPPPPIAGTKRTFHASTEPSDTGVDVVLSSSWDGERPVKRSRYAPSRPKADGEYLSDCVGQYDSVSGSCPNQVRDSVASLAAASVSPLPRKRRLSDATIHQPPKRPRCLTFEPRRHAVSDPLPADGNFAALQVFDTDMWLRSGLHSPRLGNRSVLNPLVPSRAEPAHISPTHCAPLPSSGPPLPSYQLDVSDDDLAWATMGGFDLSTSVSADPSATTASHLQTTLPHSPSDDLSVFSSPSSAGSSFDYPDYDLTNNFPSTDWTELVHALDSLVPSTSLSTSIQPNSLSSPQTSTSTPSPNTSNTSGTMFGLDPLFTSSDFLPDIDGFSMLHMPLETMF